VGVTKRETPRRLLPWVNAQLAAKWDTLCSASRQRVWHACNGG